MKKATLVGSFNQLSYKHIKQINDLQAKYDFLMILIDEKDQKEKTRKLNLLYRTYKNSDEYLLIGNNNHIEIDILNKQTNHLLNEGNVYKLKDDKEEFKFKELSKSSRAKATKTICLVGAESSGKTMLLRNISEELNLPFAAELGRDYVILDLGLYFTKSMEYIATEEDYLNILTKMHLNNEEKKKQGCKITFIDTDAVFTQYLFNRHFGYKHPIVEQFARWQKYDKYVFLGSNIQFVQDGVRLSDDETKFEMEKDLIEFYKEYDKELEFINEETWKARMDHFRKIVKEELDA